MNAFLLLLALHGPACAAEPALTFLSGGQAALSVTAADLRARKGARGGGLGDLQKPRHLLPRDQRPGRLGGPDLNEPRGITRYHDKNHLKAYIRKASDFRRTKMPDFGELEPRDLDDLMAYFDLISAQSGTK